MSRPRKIAWGLLVLTLVLIAAEVRLLGYAGPRGQALLWGSIFAEGVLGAGWVLRVRGLLPTRGRHALWSIAAVLYLVGGVAVLAIPVATGFVLALSLVALALAGWGGVAERRRTRERLTFVLRDA